MCSLRNVSSAVALCAIIATSLMPASSLAGVMSITEKTSISPSIPVDQVDWRPYPHRHRRWHTGWYYGWPRYRYGMQARLNPAYAVYGSAYPAYSGDTEEGFYGNVCQSSTGWNFGH